MRRLTQSVVAGGVVYPAGTVLSDGLEHRITNPALFEELPDEPAPDEQPSQAVQIVQAILGPGADPNVVLEGVVRLEAVVAELPVADALPAGVDVEDALAVQRSVEYVRETGDPVNIPGVRIEAADEDGQTETTLALAAAVQRVAELEAAATTGDEPQASDEDDEQPPAEPVDYSALDYEDLKAEVAKRGLEPESRSKAHQIAALVADDAK